MVVVPEIAAVVGALFAAMFVYAIVVVAKGFAGLFPTDIPILSTIHRFFYNIALVGGAAVSWIMSDIIKPLVNAIIGPILGFVRMLEGLANFASEAAHSWQWLLTHAIPGMVSKLLGRIASALTAARVYAVALVHGLATAILHDIALARAYSAALVHGLAAAVLHDIALARTYAVTLVHGLASAVLHDIATALAKAVAYARAGDAALGRALHTLEGRVAAMTTATLGLIRSEVAVGVKAAEQFSVAEAAHAIHLVDVDAAAGIAAVVDGLIIDVGDLADVIGTDLPDIGAAVRAIPRAVPTDLAGVTALLGAVAIPAIRYMRECGVPNCRNLSQYGRELNNLLGAVEDGALMGFLAMLCTDPQGVTDVVVNDLAPIITDAVDAATSLLGVA